MQWYTYLLLACIAVALLYLVVCVVVVAAQMAVFIVGFILAAWLVYLLARSFKSKEKPPE